MSEFADRYERDIIDKLWGYERDGRGKVQELCTVEVDGRQLPFVSFTTGELVVITARHHINEFWGPTETVMKLAESGQEGFTLVPVVDAENYGQSEAKKQDILRATYVPSAEAIYDMLRGYKELPANNAKNDWNDYRYSCDDSPPNIAAIKKLISSCTLFVDLHNSAIDKFLFITIPSEIGAEAETVGIVVREMENREQQVDTSYPGSICGKQLGPGVYKYRSLGNSNPAVINYAAKLGKVNLCVEIPVYSNNPVNSGQWHELNDIMEVAEVTAGTILSLKSHIEANSGY